MGRASATHGKWQAGSLPHCYVGELYAAGWRGRRSADGPGE